MTYLLGLTGSIGMGKSTTARLFADAGCQVWDADAAVHRLYAPGGAAVAPMSEVFPEAILDDGIDRARLKEILARDKDALKQIEAIVHPLVAEDREAFKRRATSDILVFDIPLLFETWGDARMDGVAVVSVDADTQKARVLECGTMTEPQFEMIRAKQMPDAEKRARATWVIVTDTLDHARTQVQAVIAEIRSKQAHA